MNYFDDETSIIDLFQSLSRNEVCFPIWSRDAVLIFKSIHSERKWKYWTNNSGKADPPPDFFSDKYNLMMEVMRVDDHAHYNQKGKIVNPVNQRESEIQKDIRKKILAHNPNHDFSNTIIYVNALSNLPTNEDHNYIYYYSNFDRVLKKHIDNIHLYKKNHPNKKLILFVFDESTGYLQVQDEELAKKGPTALERYRAKPVAHFFDRRFLEVFCHSEVDFLVWCTPYKMFHGSVFQLPKICVFDLKKDYIRKSIDYPQNLIISSEA